MFLIIATPIFELLAGAALMGPDDAIWPESYFELLYAI